MTTQSRCRQLFLAILLCVASISLQAQVTNLGPAGQYYKTAPPKKGRFSLIRPPKKGGEIKWTVAPNNHVEFVREDFAVLEPDVTIEYEDIKLKADKATINFRTKDVTVQGHVILDQGTTRLGGSEAVFNLATYTGTFFIATGSMEPAM
jgi:lipopolysaccharide assembly outer membrane protein LptD (OstA)